MLSNLPNRAKVLCALFGLIMLPACTKAETVTVKSPNGNIGMEIHTDGGCISYDVKLNGTKLISQKNIELDLSDARLGYNAKLSSVKKTSGNSTIKPVVPLKRSVIENKYNGATLTFKGGYTVEFRVMDNAVAYRFTTNLKKKQIDVVNETFDVNTEASFTAHLQQPGSFKTSSEDAYSHKPMNEWNSTDHMSTLPVLLTKNDGSDTQILISEADLYDYPCMFVKGNGNGGMSSTFPKVPLKWGYDGDRSVKIEKEAGYIARTNGSRAFPWRFFAIGNSAEILNQTVARQLEHDSEIKDVSWIRPGKVSWEWWNGAAPYGDDVNFETGCNTDTYKYFIDFASRYGIDYIILDEGWAADTRDPFTVRNEINMPELVKYGKEKGVELILWLPWLTVENHFDLFKTYAEWGVAGVKIDFMDRSDQWMVNFYERVVKEAAKNKLVVDMHGSFKPAGLETRYPNLLSYEGVRGLEQMGGCRPDNSLYLPFMRNAVGPMDYTPGAMTSMQPESYCSERPNSASIGTRAYQMALYVVFESGVQMLADSPTAYYRNPDCTKFIASVPVTWDDTRIIGARTGEYVIVAKRKGDKWYVGAICNGKENNRKFTISLDFLNGGKSYTMTSFSDGINANYQAMDYRKSTKQVDNNTKVEINLARNGGWTAVIE